ncbi:hypothetical protein ABT189_01175, partial [Streptomyces sp900105755]
MPSPVAAWSKVIPSSSCRAADAGRPGAVGAVDGAEAVAGADGVPDGAGADAVAGLVGPVGVGAGRSLASTVGLGPAGLVVVVPPSAYAPTGTTA